MTNHYTKLSAFLLILAGAFIFTSCQDSVNPSLEESVAPYLELEAIDGASNTNVTVNRGEARGLDSYFAFDLSNIETNGIVGEGLTEGWCLEWNKPIRQNNDVHQGVEFFNTFGSDTWKAPNYLMSIKDELKADDPELTYKEIQVALWSLIEEPAFNIDQVLQDGRMPSRMMTNGQPNFDVDKAKQIASKVRSDVSSFEYNPGEPVLVFAKTGDDQQNIGGVTEQTVVIDPDNLRGWAFFEEGENGSGQLTTGPGTPLLGQGSAQLTVDGTGRMLFGKIDWAGVRLDSISQLSYSTYRSSGAAPLAPSIQLNMDYDDSDASTSWQGRLVFEPYYDNTVNSNEWQTWTPVTNGRWWASGSPGDTVCPISSPCTWSEVLSNFPDAAIRDSGYTGILFKVGGPWTGGFDGNVDNFTIGVGNLITTYDFEPSN